jgi:hypothetical protein
MAVAVTPSGPDLPPARHQAPVADVVDLRLPPPPDRISASELAAATRAVLTVAAALARYLVTVNGRAPLAAAQRLGRGRHRLPQVVVGRAVRALSSAGQVAAEVAGALADVLLPTLAREALSRVDVTALVLEFVDIDRLAAALDVDAVVARVDLDAVVDRIDVAAIAAGLDLDALVEKVDIARVLNRVDLDDVVARVDLDRAVDRVDIARILGRVDLDDVVARVDLDRAVDRVDIARILGRVDLDDVVARVDLDRAVDRVDIDRIIARADVLALARWVVEEIDLPAVIRSSSSSVAAEMVRGVRDQSADADRAVERVVDRLLRRHGRRTSVEGADAAEAIPEARRDSD